MSVHVNADISLHNPYLTSDIPGCGGIIKETAEDFVVEEIPSYSPSGSGEHCYVTIEKRGVTTLEAIRRIAARLKVQERDIGYAGMKDAVGITSQTISLHRITPEKALALNLDNIRVVSAARHTNKLKLGHLRGNRFKVIINDVDSSALRSVPVVLDILAARGVPNYFGPQRYGAHSNSHLIGAAILRGDWRCAVDHLIGLAENVRDEEWRAAITAYRRGELDNALRLFPRHCQIERNILQHLTAKPEGYEKAFSSIHPRMKKLYLSAAQSFLFDQVVAKRIDGIDRLMTGDLAFKHANGACFLVKDMAEEQKRASVLEISASGPMFGGKMKCPEGPAWEIERDIIDRSGIELQRIGEIRIDGERRPLRVPLSDISYNLEGNRLRLEFSLPRGSYATSVIREISKTF